MRIYLNISAQFDFVRGTLTLRPTRWHGLKTVGSAAVLPVESEVLVLFRGWHAKAQSEFVIESDRPPRRFDFSWYRAQLIFDALIGWLHSKGITDKKPLHVLRKMFGAEMCHRHGIYAASVGLRHSDIGVTARVYARPFLTAGFGAELSGAVVSFPVPGPERLQSDNRDAEGAH
jgi:integrase